jgi:hypothetical protein
MGFPSEAARLALQQSNNDVSRSVQLIQEQPCLLNVASATKFKVQKEVLQQVLSAACYETFSQIMHFPPTLCMFPVFLYLFIYI